VRAASAVTAVRISMVAVLVLGWVWVRLRSSLMISGRRNGSSARLAGAAPTSSRAIRHPWARARSTARSSPATSPVRSRSVSSITTDSPPAADRAAAAPGGGGALSAAASTLTNSSSVEGRWALTAPSNAAIRHAQSNSPNVPWARAAANNASGV